MSKCWRTSVWLLQLYDCASSSVSRLPVALCHRNNTDDRWPLCCCWRYLSTRACGWWPRATATRRLGSRRWSSTSTNVRWSWRNVRSRSASSFTSACSCGTLKTKRARSTCGYATASRWSPQDSCVPDHCTRRNSCEKNMTSSNRLSRLDSYDILLSVWTVTVTEVLVLHHLPGVHHRVSPYPGAHRQNETEMFSDHDETRSWSTKKISVTCGSRAHLF